MAGCTKARDRLTWFVATLLFTSVLADSQAACGAGADECGADGNVMLQVAAKTDHLSGILAKADVTHVSKTDHLGGILAKNDVTHDSSIASRMTSFGKDLLAAMSGQATKTADLQPNSPKEPSEKQKEEAGKAMEEPGKAPGWMLNLGCFAAFCSIILGAMMLTLVLMQLLARYLAALDAPCAAEKKTAAAVEKTPTEASKRGRSVEEPMDGNARLPSIRGSNSLDFHAEASDALPDLEDYIEWALERVGDWGAFQHRGTFLVAYAHAICGMQALTHIFVSLPPELHRVCTKRDGHCSTDTLFEMDCTLSAEDYQFTHADRSIVSDFGLICGSAFKIPMLGTLFFFGFLIGVLVFGNFADSHGRRKAYLGSAIGLQAGAIATSLAPNYELFAAARVLVGVGVGGLGCSAFVWNAEIVGPSQRALLVLTTAGGFAIGVMLLSPFAYMIPHWRGFLILVFILGMPLLCLQHLVLESPKWLGGPAQRLEDAHAVLVRIAEVNGCPTAPPPPPLPRGHAGGSNKGDVVKVEKSLLRVLLCDPRIAWRFVVMCFGWFALSLGYYGVSMNASSMDLSIFISNAVLAFVELPTYPLALWMVKAERAGRRGTIAGSLALGGGCCVLCAAVPKNMPFVLISLAFVGKAAIAAAFGVIYLYAAELFPTDIRSRSMSLQSLVARLGGMVAPIVADMGKISKGLPFVVFGVPCLIAGALLCTLPETAGAPLLATIDDIKDDGTKRRGWPCFPRYRELEDDQDNQDGSPSAGPSVIGASVI